jgi:thioredoxin-dependent peroxiredoxin
MVDPLKATKGRRMSKKTRKKSPKTSSGKATLARSKRSSKAPSKAPPAKARKPAAKKSAGSASKPTASASPKASHKAPSKTLKSSVPGKSARVVAGSKPAAAKAETKNPPAAKASAVKTDVSPARKEAFAEGAKAPGFRLPRDGGDTVSLADFAGKKLVLFFYPRADTPGCTKEAIDFSRLKAAFAESDTAVLGVSADPLKAQESFRDKHELAIPLASDEQHEMLEAYGVWGEKSMYGKTFHGILRTTVLIGADGRIIRIWRHVRVDGHADEVLAAVRSL